MANDDQMTKLAREEILRETQRAAARASQVGSTGWMKCPLPPTNKRFIRNTLLATLTDAKRSRIRKDVSSSAKSSQQHRVDEYSKHKSKDQKYDRKDDKKKERTKIKSKEHQRSTTSNEDDRKRKKMKLTDEKFSK